VRVLGRLVRLRVIGTVIVDCLYEQDSLVRLDRETVRLAEHPLLCLLVHLGGRPQCLRQLKLYRKAANHGRAEDSIGLKIGRASMFWAV
jgi:hypothetical protein